MLKRYYLDGMKTVVFPCAAVPRERVVFILLCWSVSDITTLKVDC